MARKHRSVVGDMEIHAGAALPIGGTWHLSLISRMRHQDAEPGIDYYARGCTDPATHYSLAEERLQAAARAGQDISDPDIRARLLRGTICPACGRPLKGGSVRDL